MLLAFAPVLVRVRPETLKKDLSQYMGGWNYQALLYTLWNELSLFIVGPALMALFQRRYSRPATSRTFSARYSYTAFLVHTPVNVAIELLVEAVLCPGGEKAAWMSTAAWKAAGPVIMTVLVSAVNVVASFTIGRWLVDYVPSVRSFI
uniref:Acyltransferase 3 domain-containing protein n=2 Tax=Fusarium oxysporum TaxID=5507 RepID=A0A0C4DJJ1_FUSOF